MLREGGTLVIQKLDRLAGSLKQTIETAEHLKGSGVGLVSVTLSTPHRLGECWSFTCSAQSPNLNARSFARERLLALAEARRKGKTGGRPRRLTEKDTAGAKAMLADGALTSKEIAVRFGVSKAMLYAILAEFDAAKSGQKPT
jgi:DNA invertase Pin-like site-specific DNA recombinase